MTIDKKEFEKELILSEKGAEVLKERIDKVEELEVRVSELETKIHELERRFNKHVNTEGAHNI